ncbi:hypothetical protein [Halothiobacillus sp.]|uniref:hypothetical protein n=1 Tax=Halothiobacillus sp. TaxID=1891311 RepID=UPI00261BEF6D|nr:hypothetical protein [Halothiobacillus sp.]
MRATKTTLIGSILIGIAALSSQTWADTLTPTQSTVHTMNQEQVQSQQRQAPNAADFERLNNRNEHESRSMNRQSQGKGTGIQQQYRYGSGSMSRGGMGGRGH